MSSSQTVARQRVSRRTVTRGVAWSVPAVAVSVAAPAFAASTAAVQVASLTVCQCAGGGEKKYVVTATFNKTDTAQFDLTNVLITEGGLPVKTQNTTTATIPAGAGPSSVTFVITRQSNGATGTFGVSYTAENHTTHASVNDSYTTPGAIPATDTCLSGCP
jgi:hypothetical protein